MSGDEGGLRGRDRRHQRPCRRHRVNLRLTPAEHGALAAAARAAGLTVSGYAAAAALAAAAGVIAPGSPARQALAELLAARTAVARVGGNINQIARAANAGVDLAPNQLASALRVATTAAQRIQTAAETLSRTVS